VRLAQLSAIAQLSVPIYQGGGEYSAVRQSKETLGQQRLNLDVNRDQARATVVQSWGQLDAAKAHNRSEKKPLGSEGSLVAGARNHRQFPICVGGLTRWSFAMRRSQPVRSLDVRSKLS
jgi:hypothetical protein